MIISIFACEILAWKFVCQSSNTVPLINFSNGSFGISLVSTLYEILRPLSVPWELLNSVGVGIVGKVMAEVFPLTVVDCRLLGVRRVPIGDVILIPWFPVLFVLFVLFPSGALGKLLCLDKDKKN